MSIKLRWDDLSHDQDAQRCRRLWELAHEYEFEQLLACSPIRLEENLELIEAVNKSLGKGDKLGLHGYYHVAFSKLLPQEQKKRMQKGIDIMFKLFDVFPPFFVPPYNMYNKATMRMANELGMKVETSQTNIRRYRTIGYNEPKPSYIVYHPQWTIPVRFERDLKFLRSHEIPNNRT